MKKVTVSPSDVEDALTYEHLREYHTGQRNWFKTVFAVFINAVNEIKGSISATDKTVAELKAEIAELQKQVNGGTVLADCGGVDNINGEVWDCGGVDNLDGEVINLGEIN